MATSVGYKGSLVAVKGRVTSRFPILLLIVVKELTKAGAMLEYRSMRGWMF